LQPNLAKLGIGVKSYNSIILRRHLRDGADMSGSLSR